MVRLKKAKNHKLQINQNDLKKENDSEKSDWRIFKLKDDLSEYNVLKKKLFKLENAHEIMKDQMKVLEKKVETLQETKDLSNSENGDKCDKQFV